MPVRPNFDPAHLYFITTSAIQHLHLFARDSVKRIILDSLHFQRTAGRMKLFAFVIMPNHIHLIAQFNETYTPGDAMRDLKRHTARMILRQAHAQNQMDILTRLQQLNRAPGQVFKVWEEGYDARDIFSTRFLQQKMDYLHANPCQPHWNLAAQPEAYPWSSARFYLADQPCIIPIDDVRLLL